MGQREHIGRVLADAGFIPDDEPDSYSLALDRGVVRFGMARSLDDIERVWWTVDVEMAPPGEGPYRAGGRPTVDVPVELTLRRERSFDDVGKRLGLNREVQIGDPSFDREVYVETDASEARVREIVHAPFRKPALRVLSTGVAALILRAGAGRLTAMWEAHVTELSAERAKEIAELLLEARDALPRFRRLAPEQRRGPDVHQRVGLAAMLLAVIGVLGAALLYQRGELWRAVSTGTVLVAAAGAAALVAISWAASRGSSVGLRRMLLLAVPAALAWASWTVVAASLSLK